MRKISKYNGGHLQKGQVLVLVALIFIGLVAAIGLAIDTGYVFVYYARLRRGTDAAALSAAAQIRENWAQADLDNAAKQLLKLNGVDDSTASVATCVDGGPDPYNLCPAPTTDCPVWTSSNPLCPAGRKLVRVEASATVPLNFMAAIGISTVTLHANAVAETASVDVILVMDTSETMTAGSCLDGDDDDGDGHIDDCNVIGAAEPQFGATADDYQMKDPAYCNTFDDGDSMPGSCQPFQKIKEAALLFTDQLYFPYDRVGIVTFDSRAVDRLDLSSSKSTVQSAIQSDSIYVYDAVHRTDINPATGNTIDPSGWNPWVTDGVPGKCPQVDYNSLVNPPPGPCRAYNSDADGYFSGHFSCPVYFAGNDAVTPAISIGDPTTCPTTDTGDALYTAQNMLLNPSLKRDDSLWVVVLLSDGYPNSSGDATTWFTSVDASPPTYGYCPSSTWGGTICTHPDPSSDLQPTTRRVPTDSGYDSGDYAYDAVDTLINNNILVYSIAQESGITQKSYCGGCPPLAQTFFEYAALGNAPEGATGDPACSDGVDNDSDLLIDDCGGSVHNGLYFYSPQNGSDLIPIFLKIANDIATRITK